MESITASPKTATDITVRYAKLSEEADAFSELGSPLEEIAPVAAAAFPQRPGGLNAILGGANGELPQREDAFQLRIQAPADAENAPVVVFIPGGGFMTGTGNARWFNASELVARERIVLVTVNYRIGALGHFGNTGDPLESQRGLRDLEIALEWVRLHIGQFGGNPEDLTLAGDSAGAWYAFALGALESTRGKIARLALISFPWEPPLDAAAYEARRATLFAALERPFAEAKQEEFLAAQGALSKAFAGKGMPAMPAAAGELTSDLHEFEHSAARLHVDSLLLLSTTEEFAAFIYPAPQAAFTHEQIDGLIRAKFDDVDAVNKWINAKWGEPTPKQRMTEAMTLHQFRLAHLRLADAASDAGIEVEVGSFAVQSPLPEAYSPHCFTLPFLFERGGADADQDWADAPMMEQVDSEIRQRVAADLQRWFFGFAKSGASNRYDSKHPTRTEFTAEGVTVEPPQERDLQPRY